ncbi:hypothetical protein HD599_001309 [Conyzicola lurida]|uniref:Uncharacterized protein n=1 Tax=Conyzicola lurida TaxID=1172621 RepID=A0A841AMP3_9MICO|nr:hypothetical protein [Conyzicola lurida]MBB5842986.1 hypothetical protein [Conyzicola lurida]
MRSLTGLGIASLAALSLAGCVASPAPTASPTVIPSASSTPQADPADPATWVISIEGVGPVEFGAPVAEETADLVAAYADVSDLEACSTLMFEAEGSPTIWLAPDLDGFVSAILVTAETADGDVSAGSPRTEEGIGIGSTRDELFEAYPVVVDAVQDDVGYDTYSVEEFEGRWVHFDVGPDDTVIDIVVNAADAPPYEFCG